MDRAYGTPIIAGRLRGLIASLLAGASPWIGPASVHRLGAVPMD